MAASRSFKLSPFKIPSFSVESFFFLLGVLAPLLIICGRSLADIAMGAVSVYFLYRCWRDKNWQWTKTPWVRLAFVVWLYLIGVSIFADFNVVSALKRGIGWFRFPLFTVAFATLYLPQEKYRNAVRIFLVTLLSLIALDTIVQFLLGVSLSGNTLPLSPGRLSGPFGQSMVVGVYLARLGWVAIGLLFAWGVAQKSVVKRLFVPIFFTALLAGTILLSGERVVLALFGLSACVFWIFSKKLRAPLFVAAAIGLVTLGSLLWFNQSLHTRFITNTEAAVQQGDDSSYGRVWHNAIVAWKLSPIFGVGPHNYVAACDTLREKGGFRKEAWYIKEFNCARHPHNLYVEWLVETGVFGLLFFIGLVALWFKEAWQNIRNAQGEHYFAALGFFVALIPFLWPLMSSMSFFSNWSAILFWWTLSFALSKPQIRS